MSEQLHVLRTNAEIDALIAYLQDPDKNPVSYDTETTSLSLDAKVVGLSICAEPTVAYYIITAEWHVEKIVSQVPCAECKGTGHLPKKKKALQAEVCPACCGLKEETKTEFYNGRLIELPNREKVIELLHVLMTKSLITHNGIVDINWTHRNYGIDIRPAVRFDTMIAAHLINENRRVGLKELGYGEFGADAKKEQEEMRESVIANGGVWETKRGGNKEMFKASPGILGKYGAKDALLTQALFYKYAGQLEDQSLVDFFFEESMPLFLGPIYELNTTGLKCDGDGFRKLQKELEDECAMLEQQIQQDIEPYVRELYPRGFGKKDQKKFNIGSGQQLAWLLFIKLENDWKRLTDAGRELAKELLGKAPYNPSGRRNFEREIAAAVDEHGKTIKLEKYLSTNKTVLSTFAHKYKWVERLLQYKKASKLLQTYVIGIQEKMEYGVVHPSFFQTGTTGNRLSSARPNFQNLPRDDKRVKSCIVARPGKVFVGGDFEQIEPRVFASLSGDKRLMECFARGEDFYSVVGISTFKKFNCTPFKSGKGSFGEMYPLLRQVAKTVALAATYGVTAFKLIDMLNVNAPRKEEGPWTIEEVQEIIDAYFEAYPEVKKMQLKFHKIAIDKGVVFNIFGRPRHIPGARAIKRLGKQSAKDLPYEYRTLLNNACNFPIQGSAGSIMNRSMISAFNKCRELEIEDPAWAEVKIIGQVHDEAWLEGPEHLAEQMVKVLKHCMENAAVLPGVALKASPKIARNLAELK